VKLVDALHYSLGTSHYGTRYTFGSAFTKQKRRLEEIEHRVANDPERQRQSADAARHQRDVDTWALVLAVFPEDLRPRILDVLKSNRGDVHSKHLALSRLFWLIYHGEWQPTPFPRALAEVYLDDPKALAWSKCQACGLPLPRRWGFWVEAGTGGWWQAPLRYFDRCPACGGEVGNWSQHDVSRPCPWLPAVPNEKYHFQDDCPATPHVEALP
jgi:hypothetical protein